MDISMICVPSRQIERSGGSDSKDKNNGGGWWGFGEGHYLAKSVKELFYPRFSVLTLILRLAVKR